MARRHKLGAENLVPKKAGGKAAQKTKRLGQVLQRRR